MFRFNIQIPVIKSRRKVLCSQMSQIFQINLLSLSLGSAVSSRTENSSGFGLHQYFRVDLPIDNPFLFQMVVVLILQVQFIQHVDVVFSLPYFALGFFLHSFLGLLKGL